MDFHLTGLQILLNEILPNYKQGEISNKRLGKTVISEIEIPLLTKNKEIDIDFQEKIVLEYVQIEKIKPTLRSKLEKISKSQINLFDN